MTFKQAQDRVMGRLNLTSADARTRIKEFLNERYRELQTSVGLGRVRRTTGTLNTVNGTPTYTPAGFIKIFQIAYPAGNKILLEKSEDYIREVDPNLNKVGDPEYFVTQKFTATGVVIRIWPTPTSVMVLNVDGLASGTELSADGDVPAFPEDFHDILVYHALADELDKMEKPDLSSKMAKRAEKRTSELRYFLAKSAYLYRQQGTQFWWWGPHLSRPYGWA